MKDIELAFYENYCKKCKSEPHCPWLCISGDTCLELTQFEAKETKAERKECFLCHREFFVDDPEFNAEKRICDNCAEQLEKDNPYNGYNHDDNDE